MAATNLLNLRLSMKTDPEIDQNLIMLNPKKKQVAHRNWVP